MKTTLRRTGAVATLAALVAVALPVVAHAADLDEPLRLETGHIDTFNLALNEDNSIRLNLKEDVTGSRVQRTPESVELFVKDEALQTGLPAAYLPPGAPTELYYLPLTQDQNLIWPGWDSQQVGSYYGAQADVDINISAVDGPGEVYLWTNGTFGDVRSLLTDGGHTLPGVIHQDFLAHVHANWGFTEPGTYELTAQATVTSQDGSKTSTSQMATYTFQVGESDEVDPPVGDTTVSVSGVSRHYHTGDVASLRAVQSPAPTSDHYHWFTRASAGDEWVVVEDALSDTYSFVVTAAQQVKVAIYDGEHNVIDESDPVDIAVDDHGNTPVIGPEIETTLPETEGALVISVSEEGRKAVLSDLTLSSAADRYESEGEITGITVTDTRQDNLGWTANGRVRSLATSGGGSISGTNLGWTPAVVSATGPSVTPGDAVAPGFVSGNGIRSWQELGSAPAGSSIGTAVLGADVKIEAPLTIPTGTYKGYVLLSVI